MDDTPLKMTFDPATIEHLGVRMYSTLSPVLAELVANSYDADASNVTVLLNDTDDRREIIVEDDGSGMSLEEINSKFLRIGRNRRDDERSEDTIGGRKVIGKKGIGKLSFFGIAEEIEVVTKKDLKENAFVLKWQDIKDSKTPEYKPTPLKIEEPCGAECGTKITLRGLRRKTEFDPESIAVALSKIFIVDDSFVVSIQHNEKESFLVENKKKYDDLKKQIEWDVPKDIGLEAEYERKNQITGHFISTETPISSKTNMRGITLFSRKKLVNLPEYFSESISSHFFSYLTGHLEVDFIDELDEDVIATDRQSLNWGHPEMAELRDFLGKLMSWLEHDWRIKRDALKKKKISEQTGINTAEWLKTIPEELRGSVESVIKAIVQDSEIPEEASVRAVRDFHALVPDYPKYHWRQLHAEVQDASRAYYQGGDYYHAFIEASKRYVNAVRAKAVRTTRDERALMQEVFPEASPVLSVTETYFKRDGTAFTADTLKNIRVAQQMFSEGVICGGRHPISHEEIEDLRQSKLFTEEDCLDVLSLLSHLFWRLEHSTKVR
ncbi:MAG: hypothetical protein UU88_C0007G0018 [Parcubacteria group bacterium GW2011_GWC1_42_11]|uniref:Conserved hypothetical protein CHP02391 domain-containing protein n=1 Tax=Candidatus Nomurabacteria bacterium GW2011_GWC2_42_20 TaxID=1618756 RepID=A0A0G1CCW2_9BACT|nr:MAG: hypothetical protein UU88_C0007G0018 [Parcubacteria group bacterium GW2011_GWC1_42_11]KKS47478.1 MAG: hypothetical protein UV12_C0007G0018 [Candidatus Nomurabacteria bacterium GW2011_GWC2_42_20]KKS59143.1 MAG: hypothetical protein UV24_C0006G0013 [Candidatus Nomurabacteria bacterium GW2011_GWA2_42_41]KKT09501.1 MAG: hypothetical protein UV86_C0006G0016 [Candidatus Nomurabacteria bacterium GW2011_GWB1_43_20]